jgi:hypothetical protein
LSLANYSFSSSSWCFAKRLLDVNLDRAPNERRKVARVELFRQEQVIVCVILSPATIDYRVRLEGAVDFTAPRK